MTAARAVAQRGGSPAHAGIDPTMRRRRRQRAGFPRIRGDRPQRLLNRSVAPVRWAVKAGAVGARMVGQLWG